MNFSKAAPLGPTLAVLLALAAACESSGDNSRPSRLEAPSKAGATDLPECYREVVAKLAKVFRVRGVSLEVDYKTLEQFQADRPWIPEGWGAPARKVEVRVQSGGFAFEFEVFDGASSKPIASQHISNSARGGTKALARWLLREDPAPTPLDVHLPWPSFESATGRIGRYTVEAKGRESGMLFAEFADDVEHEACHQQLERDSVLQAVGRVRYATRPRTVITFARSDLGLPLAADFTTLETARAHFHIPDGRQSRSSTTRARVRQLRDAGMTQRVAAQELGMSCRTIQSYWSDVQAT